jgi:predicted ribosome quality control (RQC) complex YloA/Tae2 family protein
MSKVKRLERKLEKAQEAMREARMKVRHITENLNAAKMEENAMMGGIFGLPHKIEYKAYKPDDMIDEQTWKDAVSFFKSSKP